VSADFFFGNIVSAAGGSREGQVNFCLYILTKPVSILTKPLPGEVVNTLSSLLELPRDRFVLSFSQRAGLSKDGMARPGNAPN
jgi:hypothetical protein